MPNASPGVYRFEAIDDTLPFLPLAARRVLDGLGRKLSLDGWLSLGRDDRARLIACGSAEDVGPEALHLLARARPAPTLVDPLPEPNPETPPAQLLAALGPNRLDPAKWRALRPLDRYALAKCASKPEKLALAFAEIVGPVLTHLTARGDAHMVDIGQKHETLRRAVASARVRSSREVVAAVSSGSVPKGDVVAAARVAGILAVKRTTELIPLCHPVRTTHASIDVEACEAKGTLEIRATVEAVDRTGVEMEAMVAASVAALTIYDMIKAADRWAVVERVQLESKSGGKSGEVTRAPDRSNEESTR